MLDISKAFIEFMTKERILGFKPKIIKKNGKNLLLVLLVFKTLY